jgi:hypothetical protein
MERCFFVDSVFFNSHFTHALDFSWANHKQRLLKLGHDVSAPGNNPKDIPHAWADIWLFEDMHMYYKENYGVQVWKEPDWSAALLHSNPHHMVKVLLLTSASLLIKLM